MSDRTDDVQDWLAAIRAVGYGPELAQSADMAEELAQARQAIARLEAERAARSAPPAGEVLPWVDDEGRARTSDPDKVAEYFNNGDPRHGFPSSTDVIADAVAQARADACEEVAQAIEAGAGSEDPVNWRWRAAARIARLVAEAGA